MKLHGGIKTKITNNENGEIVPKLEITEVVLVYFNIVRNDYQQDSRVLYKFVPNKSFRWLLDISPKHVIFLKAFNSELLYTEICFIYQNSKLLYIEDRTNVINY